MPIALTCDCGARFDLDDDLAGKEVPCPECLQPLEAPAGASSAVLPRTSSLALASIVLALLGAFTVAGTVLAVILGCAALVRIRVSRGRLVGGGLAFAGIVAGLGFTALTLSLLLRWPNLVSIDLWMRQHTSAAQVDNGGAMEVLSRDGNVVLTRPSPAWGRVQGERSDDPFVGEIQEKRELLLANVRRLAFLDVARLPGKAMLSDMTQEIEKDLLPSVPPPLFGDDDDDAPARFHPPRAVYNPRDRDAVGNWEAREWCYDVLRGGQTWRFLIRAYKKRFVNDRRGAAPVYIVRGYAPKKRFDAVKEEFIVAMNRIELPK